MKEHNIGIREGVMMMLLFLSAKVFLPMPRAMAEAGGTAGWAILLVGGLLSSLTVVAVLTILQRYPGKTLITATEAALGPYIGNLFNLSYFSGYLAVCVFVLRQFSEDFAFTVLLKTPLAVVTVIILLAVSFLAYQGIEAIARLAWILGPVILGSLGLLLLGGLMTHAEPNALAPYLGTGLVPVFSQGVVKTAMYAELLTLGLIGPAFRKPQALRKTAWLALFLSILVMTVSEVVYLYVFPYPAATRISFPLLSVSRVISVGRWLSRLEGVFLINWLFAAVIMLGLALFSATTLLSQMLRLQNYRPLIFPLAVLTYSFSLLPANLSQATLFAGEYLRSYGGIVSIILPLVTAGVALWRGRGGVRRASG